MLLKTLRNNMFQSLWQQLCKLFKCKIIKSCKFTQTISLRKQIFQSLLFKTERTLSENNLCVNGNGFCSVVFTKHSSTAVVKNNYIKALQQNNFGFETSEITDFLGLYIKVPGIYGNYWRIIMLNRGAFATSVIM